MSFTRAFYITDPTILKKRSLGSNEQPRRSNEAGAVWLLREARSIWKSHAHPFPFRWPATFPLIAQAEATDHFEEAKELLMDLIHPTQQAMPPELDQTIRKALES